MKIAIMQPYLFPYLGYFQLIKAVDTFVFYDDVNYINRGWINRNNILTNGKPLLFTVPLIEASQNKTINEIIVDSSEKWKNKLLKTIEMSYKRAVNFQVVYELINYIFKSNYSTINELNFISISEVLKYIGVNTKIIKSSECFSNQHLKGQYKILDICKQLNAHHYINPPGGKEIYQPELFNQNNIAFNFIETDNIKYKQFNDFFIPNLSIIDVLMFNTKEQVLEMLNLYKLV